LRLQLTGRDNGRICIFAVIVERCALKIRDNRSARRNYYYCYDRYRELFYRCTQNVRNARNPTLATRHGHENSRYFPIWIYSTLSQSARASRAYYIAMSIESGSFKAVVVDLGGYYWLRERHVRRITTIIRILTIYFSFTSIIGSYRSCCRRSRASCVASRAKRSEKSSNRATNLSIYL
jgi:hypothetical protein